MKKWLARITVLLLVFTVQGSIGDELKKAGEGLSERSRCPVCGMFVARYPQWITQIILSDGRTAYFDGVKDMLAFYFGPQRFGAQEGSHADELMVKDYYSQEWVDGKQAMYVLGSDVYGPMGYELVPFASQAGAENFLKDHHGRRIYSFPEITPELVESLRKGHTMPTKK